MSRGADVDLCFPARVEPEDEGGISVTFRDLSEAITGSNEHSNALQLAEDCLHEALARRMSLRDSDARRILDPRHETPPEAIQAALAMLGKRVRVTARGAA